MAALRTELRYVKDICKAKDVEIARISQNFSDLQVQIPTLIMQAKKEHEPVFIKTYGPFVEYKAHC
jgi:hypothetical protein